LSIIFYKKDNFISKISASSLFTLLLSMQNNIITISETDFELKCQSTFSIIFLFKYKKSITSYCFFWNNMLKILNIYPFCTSKVLFSSHKLLNS
jgi:hypothetical protein